MACGTGDLSILFAKALSRLRAQSARGPGCVLAADFTFQMLPIAVGKWTAHRKARPSSRLDSTSSSSARPSSTTNIKAGSNAEGCADGKATDIDAGLGAEGCADGKPTVPVVYVQGDAMALPLADASVDVVSIAFGLRNVAEPRAALREFARVLKPCGRLIVLEFSEPTLPVVRWVDRLYRRHIMPRTAAMIARDRVGAYAYLPRSVATFASGQAMLDMIESSGLREAVQREMTLGVASVYRAVKP